MRWNLGNAINGDDISGWDSFKFKQREDRPEIMTHDPINNYQGTKGEDSPWFICPNLLVRCWLEIVSSDTPSSSASTLTGLMMVPNSCPWWQSWSRARNFGHRTQTWSRDLAHLSCSGIELRPDKISSTHRLSNL